MAEGELEITLQQLSGELLANSWFTNFAVKKSLMETDGMSLADALSHEHYRHPGNAPDHQKRIARFRRN